MKTSCILLIASTITFNWRLASTVVFQPCLSTGNGLMASVADIQQRSKRSARSRRPPTARFRKMMFPSNNIPLHFSKHKYIEYQEGELNVVLSVPHGGRLRPGHIPNRDAGYLDIESGKVRYDHESTKKDPDLYPIRYKKDTNTIELASYIANELKVITGKRPHVVMCHLHRTKLDANCDKEKATFGVPDAVNAWKAFHCYIERAKKSFGGIGLFFDIHGQAHPENWVELGYTVSSEALNSNNFTAQHTSIFHLARRHQHIPLQELISGLDSFGGMLLAEGYKVVPSPTYPRPGSGNFYTGGYNTQLHGSRNDGEIDGIQIESPRFLRDPPMITEYAKAVARTIVKYLELYYNPEAQPGEDKSKEGESSSEMLDLCTPKL